MTFPLITIPDPAAVGAWLDEHVPCVCPHRPSCFNGIWEVAHWDRNTECFTVKANTPIDLLPAIHEKLKQRDPLAKLRRVWEAMGKPDLNVKVDLPDTAAQDSASKSNNPAVSG